MPASPSGLGAIISRQEGSMTLARLLAAALLICSLPAFAQDQQSQSSRPSTGVTTEHVRKGPDLSREAFFFALNLTKAATPAEPWRLISKTPVAIGGVNALDPVRVDQYHPDRHEDDSAPTFVAKARSSARMPDFLLDGDGDTACFKIRSYVVARDSKDSDSTHPVSYTTCQPSSRYGLKTTEMRTSSADR